MSGELGVFSLSFSVSLTLGNLLHFRISILQTVKWN